MATALEQTTTPDGPVFGSILKGLIEIISNYGIQIIAALLTLIIGRFIVKLLTKAVRITLEKRNVEPSLA